MSKNQTMSQGARSAENVRLAGGVQGAQTLGKFDSVSVDASDDSAVSTALHPLRLLGMGFFVAWLCCVHIPSIFCGESTVLRSAASMGMRVGDIGMFVIMALIASRLGPLSSQRAMGNVLVAATTALTAALGYVLVPGDANATLVFVAGIASALGGAYLFCLWAEIYCQLGTMQMVVYGGGSCVAAWATYCLISTMTHNYSVAATALLPVLSLACAWASFRIVAPERPAPCVAVEFRIPWKIVGIMALAGLASGISGLFANIDEGMGAIHRIWATAVAGGALMYAAFHGEKSFDLRKLAQACLIAAIAAYAFTPLAFAGLGAVVSFLAKLAYVWFTVFALAMLANVAFRFEIPSLRMFAIARASSEGAILVGVLVRDGLRALGVVPDAFALSAVAGVGLLLVGVSVLVWRSEESVNADWGAAGIDLESGQRAVGQRERLLARCSVLREQFGLTERETELLALIAQGKTRAEIERELFLSQNTVKTHARHLYAKLGVHSKDEVQRLVV